MLSAGKLQDIMSLQRIFEMVKRQGMPLVVTDGQGRDPVIVLPLDVYEALIETSGNPSVRTQPVSYEQEPPEADLLAELSTEERFYIDATEEAKID